MKQLIVGIVGLGLVTMVYTIRKKQRATTEFFSSLFTTASDKLSKTKYAYFARGPVYFGNQPQPHTYLSLKTTYKSLVIVSENRSGKTVYICNNILNRLYPWYTRYFFPPRGLFLVGHQRSQNINQRLKNQLPTSGEDPWGALTGHLSQRRNEQRIRLFLQRVFKDRLPALLSNQPVVVVVDQAEELLRAHRAEFLVFYNIVKEGRDGTAISSS